MGDDGDSFNYSPPREDLEVYSKDFTPEISITGSSLIQNAEINFMMKVPANLKQRAKKIQDTDFPITLVVGLGKYSKVIDITVR